MSLGCAGQSISLPRPPPVQERALIRSMYLGSSLFLLLLFYGVDDWRFVGNDVYLVESMTGRVQFGFVVDHSGHGVEQELFRSGRLTVRHGRDICYTGAITTWTLVFISGYEHERRLQKHHHLDDCYFSKE